MQSESQSAGHGGLGRAPVSRQETHPRCSPIFATSCSTISASRLRVSQPDGAVISRAPDLRTLEWAIQALPGEYLLSNVGRSDFCTWLMARTEFELAEAIRKIVQQPDEDPGSLRRRLLGALRTYRGRSSAASWWTTPRERSRAAAASSESAGLTGREGARSRFLNALINRYQVEHRFPDVRIFVPPTARPDHRVFDRFMESSGLLSYALQESDDDRITEAFLDADLPAEATDSLWNFLQWVRYPLPCVPRACWRTLRTSRLQASTRRT